MSKSLSDFQVFEDSIAIVKGPNGLPCLVIPTCSAIKFSNGVTLQTLLMDMLSRLEKLEDGQNLTWNGIAQNNGQNNNNS